MEVDREKVVAWLKEKWKVPTVCPVCGHNNWNILAQAWEAREYHGGPMMARTKLLPFVSVMCNFCGHTLLFNAIALDVVERPQEAEDEDG